MLKRALAAPLASKRLLSTKPFYITTPIFYPNAAPHLGHLYSMLLCDVRNRWEKLRGNDSFFSTGTDEHGLKIQTAAEKKGIPPKEFVDQLAVGFKDLAKLANIEYDRFIRTTDDDHVEAVKHFWKLLNDNGLIYQGEHSGWYSVSDETFYPETQIFENEGKYYSKESGSEVIYETEKNYFFKLSAFRDDLIKTLETNPTFIIPQQKHTDVLNELKNNELQDLSISRPSTRLKWGITVPDDESQKIYVWVDALVNYLTTAGYPSLINIWPATHLIGKDITRFHCIYWPALLLANGVELPQQIVVHGHWLADGFKMSKSRGNVVDPVLMAQYYGTDILRFFLCENSVLNADNNFSEEKLFSTREQIVDKFANLVMRSCGPKFNVERALANYENLDINTIEEPIRLAQSELVDAINGLHEKMDPKMVDFNTASAIQDIWSVIVQANQFFQMAEPWKKDEAHKDFIVYSALEAARVCAILSQPFMPEFSLTLLKRIGVQEENISLKHAKFRADQSYGEGINRAGDHPIAKIKRREI